MVTDVLVSAVDLQMSHSEDDRRLKLRAVKRLQ